MCLPSWSVIRRSPVLPARPVVVVVPDPEADAELAPLRDEKAGLEQRVHACRERAAGARSDVTQVEY